MNKNEFLKELKNSLKGLPKAEAENTINYYNEMIDEAVENGENEKEFIKSLGSQKEIAAEVLKNTPIKSLVKEKTRNKKLTVLEIVLLVLGAPIWISVALAILSVIFSVYISIWSVVVSFFAVVLALGLGGIALVLGSFIFIFIGKIATFLVAFGAGFICMGLCILLIYVTILLTKGVIILSKKIVLGIKSLIIGGNKNA